MKDRSFLIDLIIENTSFDLIAELKTSENINEINII